MPQPTKGARLGGGAAHQKLILANLATALFEHGRITTTEAKARRVRPLAEKLITKAKKGDLHNRRLVARTIRDKSVVHALFTEIAPSFESRPGGYTRITKIGPRKGDNAPMAIIELVTEPMAAATGGKAPKVSEAELPAEGDVTLSKAAADVDEPEAPKAEDTKAEDTEAEAADAKDEGGKE